MYLLKTTLTAFLLFLPSHTLASDSAVAYAHMQNGHYELAYKEFRGLAERGYPVYMNIIAEMHLKAQGVPASQLMAHIWYSLSAAQQNNKGIQGKAELEKSLSDQQIIDSTFLAKDYAQKYLEPYVAGWSLN